MATPRGENLRHIIVTGRTTPEPYAWPREVRGGGAVSLPDRDRASHGRAILRKLQQARSDWGDITRQREAAGISTKRGMYLEFRSDPGFKLALKSLDRVKERIELTAVRQHGDVQLATVYVPQGKLNNLERLVTRYVEEDDRRSGKPKNKTLVESIANIRRAALRSFWTDAQALFPAGDSPIWWEVWLRAGQDREALRNDFEDNARALGIHLKKESIVFPDRTVLLAHATPDQMSQSVQVLDSIAELRKAKDPPSFYTDMSPGEQGEWVDDLRRRLSPAHGDIPAVCLLDTGVNGGHPLLRPSLDDEDMHTHDPDWGVDDRVGHGTEMAGVALLGDLTAPLSGNDPVVLEHRLESVKLLPPPDFSANDPDLYGAITAECVGRVEITAPTRARALCMAVTAPDHRDYGLPSSWSGELDQLCAGVDNDGERRRLVLVSAGNVKERTNHPWGDYPDTQDLSQVQDPGQAWNVLTVGGCTDKCVVDDESCSGWPVVAPAGDLSPLSTTSVAWDKPWPNKPDIVMEAGNAALDPSTGEADVLDDLALLTTYHQPMLKLVVPTCGTSPATAEAARMAAILMSRYPELWPETIRALMVHAAEWTPAMLESTGTDKNLRLRRHGYGRPSLDRACWSASNALTLVVQQRLRPLFKEGGKGPVKYKDMHLHALPWPREALEALGAQEVQLRVTLSYFIEPSPGRIGWTYKHRYRSYGLRFHMQKPDESPAEFRARVSKSAQREEYDIPSPGDRGWEIGETLRNRGSVHSDIWTGTAADLAARDHLAVFPVGGWWKERHHLGRWDREVPYALVVSIQAPEVDVDLYTPVLNAITPTVDVPVG